MTLSGSSRDEISFKTDSPKKITRFLESVIEKNLDENNLIHLLEQLFVSRERKEKKQINSVFHHYNLLTHVIALKMHELAGHLIDRGILDYEPYANDVVPSCLLSIRTYTWSHPHEIEKYKILSEKLRKYKPETRCAFGETLENMVATDAPDLDAAHKQLFHTPFDSKATGREVAIKKALAQYYVILSDVTKCVPYINFINKQLKQYYFDKHHVSFPHIKEEEYTFESFGSLYFPVPCSKEYKGIQKHSALREYFTALFQSYGLAKTAYKWSGLIPNEIADEALKHGDYITESRFQALFHGKDSHMIQQAILILACENKEIDLSYLNGNIEEFLTVLDLVVAHFDLKNPARNEPLWIILRDIHHKNENVFYDPFCLSSFIMCYEEGTAFPCLADFLRDSFIMGYLKLFQMLKSHCNFPSSYNLADFLLHMQDSKISSLIDVPWILEQEIKHQCKNQYSLTQYDEQALFAVGTKLYLPLQSFKLQPFSNQQQSGLVSEMHKLQIEEEKNEKKCALLRNKAFPS